MLCNILSYSCVALCTTLYNVPNAACRSSIKGCVAAFDLSLPSVAECPTVKSMLTSQPSVLISTMKDAQCIPRQFEICRGVCNIKGKQAALLGVWSVLALLLAASLDACSSTAKSDPV